MTTVQDIEAAAAPPPEELSAFAVPFEAFYAARFDAAIEGDAASGKLDRLAEAALADYAEGRAREL